MRGKQFGTTIVNEKDIFETNESGQPVFDFTTMSFNTKSYILVKYYDGYWDNATPDSFQLTLGKHFLDHQLNFLAEVMYVRAQNRLNPENPYTGAYYTEGDIPFDDVDDNGTYYQSPRGDNGRYRPSKAYSNLSLSPTYKPKSGF